MMSKHEWQRQELNSHIEISHRDSRFIKMRHDPPNDRQNGPLDPLGEGAHSYVNRAI
jgi:hypothetical protein